MATPSLFLFVVKQMLLVRLVVGVVLQTDCKHSTNVIGQCPVQTIYQVPGTQYGDYSAADFLRETLYACFQLSMGQILWMSVPVSA